MQEPKYKILVIDDEPGYRKFYNKILTKTFSAEVIEACNPKDAFDYLKGNDNPDLILLDMQMPVMDGHTALRKIRGNPKTKEIPVIAATALNTPELVAGLLKLNISDYIVKPTNSQIAIQKIKKVLDNIE